MSHRLDADLCVIGAGSGGLTVAAGAAQMGARVVLIEATKWAGTASTLAACPPRRSSRQRMLLMRCEEAAVLASMDTSPLSTF